MTFSASALPAIITGCFAVVFTYMYVRRTFWAQDETQEAARWYGEQRQWEVRKQDLVESAEYIKHSAQAFGHMAVASWLGTLFLGARLLQ